MLSSQRLWPRSCNARVGFMASPFGSNGCRDVWTNGSVWVNRADRQPRAAVTCEQPVGGGRTGAAGSVIGKVRGRSARPGINQAVNRTPRHLDGIGPLEQSGVADQTVVDQRLVTHRCNRLEVIAVCKIHRYAVDLNLGARTLGAEANRQALIRLNADR